MRSSIRLMIWKKTMSRTFGETVRGIYIAAACCRREKRRMKNLAFHKRIFMTAAAAAMLAVGAPLAVHAQDNPNASTQEINNKKVTLNLENADIRYALKLLFQSVGANYTLDQNVQGTVTVSLTDVPFRTALESILRSAASANPLTYRVENGVYNIAPKAPEESGPTQVGAPEPEPTEAPSRTVKIQ